MSWWTICLCSFGIVFAFYIAGVLILLACTKRAQEYPYEDDL